MTDERPLLPDQTGDDTDIGWGEDPDDAQPGSAEERLRRDRPPHYDR